MSLRDQILSASDLKSETIGVPEWGCSVTVREMTLKRYFQWREVAFDADGKVIEDGNHRGRLLLFCLEDANGKLIFMDEDDTGKLIYRPEDAAALEGKSGAIIGKLFAIAKRQNGLESGADEEAEKNS